MKRISIIIYILCLLGCTFNTNKLDEQKNSDNITLSIYYIRFSTHHFSKIEYSVFPKCAEYKIDYVMPEKTLVAFDEIIKLMESPELTYEDVRGFDATIGFTYKNSTIIIDPYKNIAYNGSKYFLLAENSLIEICDLLPSFLAREFIRESKHFSSENIIDPNMIIEKGLPKITIE